MLLKYCFSFILILQICLKVWAIDHSLLDSYRPKPTALIKSYEKILKMSLESLYPEDEREHNMTAETILVSQNCSEAFQQFSFSTVNFTSCAVKNARPIHMCVECGNLYNDTVAAYSNLKQQAKECQEFYFSSDQVAIVDVIYNEVIRLWTNNYCSNCYQSTTLTEEFFNISSILMNCVLNSNKTDLLPANTTCLKCHSLFADLSDKYSLFVNSPGDYGQVCMDVVDTMNITRKIWKEYNCITPFDSDMGYPNIIVALVVGVTPFLFYLLAKNVSSIEDIKIVRPKRKFNASSSLVSEAPKE